MYVEGASGIIKGCWMMLNMSILNIDIVNTKSLFTLVFQFLRKSFKIVDDIGCFNDLCVQKVDWIGCWKTTYVLLLMLF
jgi:hypothetical protein